MPNSLLIMFLCFMAAGEACLRAQDTCQLIECSRPCENPLSLDLGVCDTIRVGCQIYVESFVVGDSFPIPIYLWNDYPVGGFSLGFTYNSDFVEITSWSLEGSIVPQGPGSGSIKLETAEPSLNQFMIGWIDMMGSEPITPTSFSEGQLIGTLYMRILPGVNSQVIDLDSTFVGPAGTFMLASLVDGVEYDVWPRYVDCDSQDVILGGAGPLCGDINGSGGVNLADIVCLVCYLFQSCDNGDCLHLEPSVIADVNCDNKKNLTDAVYLVNYIFSGGPSPCASCK